MTQNLEKQKAIQINTIYNENNLVTMARMPDNYVDLTITSPPYNLGKKHHTGAKVFDAYDKYEDDLPENVYQEGQIKMLKNLYRITKQGGSVMYNHKNRISGGVQISPYQWLLKTEWTIKQEIVWYNGGPNFDKIRFYPMTERIYWLNKGVSSSFRNVINQTDLIKDLPSGTKGEHKRSFPLKLAQRLIMCFPDAKIIYDPYMGSGTTAIASIEESRDYIGSDISGAYVKQSKKRVSIRVNTPKLFQSV